MRRDLKVWTIANQKGGVGKTTTVASLAGALVKRGQKVLMIDTDPHASLGYYLGIDSEEIQKHESGNHWQVAPRCHG